MLGFKAEIYVVGWYAQPFSKGIVFKIGLRDS
jgi:hypothetical protein